MHIRNVIATIATLNDEIMFNNNDYSSFIIYKQ